MVQLQNGIYYLLAFLMGISMSVYLPANGLVSKHIGSSITANFTFFTVAFFTSAIVLVLFGDLGSLSNIRHVPVYMYATGCAGALIVLGMTFLIPIIGARSCFILLIGGQILMAMIVSHFAILSSPADPLTVKKIIGAIIVVAGAIISTY